MNAEEIARYRRHTLNGEAALLPLGQLQHVARLVRSQHERIDGKGFPDGLGRCRAAGGAGAGHRQRLSRRAVGPHGRAAFHPAQALLLARGGGGTRYEPEIVEAFELALTDEPEDVPRDRQISPQDVEPGMVLARDLLTPKGTLLLAAGHVFDARLVRQIREFAGREGVKLALFVQPPDGDAAPAPRRAAAPQGAAHG